MSPTVAWFHCFAGIAGDMALGALVGWLVGSAGIGLLVGAILGIPLAIAVVYGVYSRAGL